MTETLPIDAIRYVKELYPRLEHDEAAIERYRVAIDRLPPIVVARGGILVDGYHRWQAYRREDLTMIPAVDLGNLSDDEILRESVRLNATHGQQLSKGDKAKLAKALWPAFDTATAVAEIATLLSVSERSVQLWTREARDAAESELQTEMWDLWLNGHEQKEIARRVGWSESKVSRQLQERKDSFLQSVMPPESRQHFDIWQLGGDDDSAYFGRLPAGLVENLLWLYTDPFQTVFDPFAGRGTTVKAAKRMGRRVWASDRQGNRWDETLPIHAHDITTGWPDDAPGKVDFILLDPPYWQQAKGKYSDDAEDLGNMSLAEFYDAWDAVIKTCVGHLADGGHIAFIISPTQEENGPVIDHAYDMIDRANVTADLTITRRIIVPYSTQQATGQQVTWARENKRLLKLYRDLVVMTR